VASSTPQQLWDPARYARNARFVADLGVPLLDLLVLKPGMHVLDLGCGDGALTERIAATGARVRGIDASAEQVAAARARGLDAEVGDGARLAFDGVFDGVLSNAVLHWIKAADAVIAGVWRALEPGGRFVGEMGGAGNVAVVRDALYAALRRGGVDPEPLDPWLFPEPADYRGRLEAAGFTVRQIALFERPTPLPGSLDAWLATFADSFLAPLDAPARAAVIADVVAAARPALFRQETWVVDYVRLRFVADKPA
jgi:SAM-dependent methyltransferase